MTARTKITETTRALIIDAYAVDRLSVRAVAAKYGCSYGTAHRILSDAGKIRRRGDASKAPRTDPPSAA